ncbi:WD40/YVTN repeat-like-containing domain,WD40 repeat [Cinara cedri]|uniref:WD40/YVTN repeat-like-containing domain,WD40 repeat n=1 Tax=Cinara cedri TaxID=506608 RepID=A0A5E4NFJ2_9HEMI|nr:WD40/YVTN repeat-like-containing domain,WD40 repeat [Cinara cedri]
MCSLRDFPELRDYSLTDKNASMNLVIRRIKPEIIGYPNIVVQLHGNQNQLPLFLPSAEPTALQKIIANFVEEDFWIACDEVIKYLNRTSRCMSICSYPLRLMMTFSSHANLKGSEKTVLSNLSRTKLWLSSVIRCMAWHSQTIKLAIASSHDIVFVYNQKGSEARIKNKSQSDILSLAWRPMDTGTLAVGCEKGIFIWNVECTNLHQRPSVNNVCTFVRKDHRYINGLSWNKMGDLLISSAVTSKTMYIWSYPLETCVPMRRLSFQNLNFVHWSPDNTKVFSCSINDQFRIWSTDKWTSDKWSVSNGSRVQCACWSPCSSILLFATDSCPTINAIDLRKSNVFKESTSYPKAAWPIIDLNSECVNDKLIGGTPTDMCWDQNGKRLAITFKKSAALVVFQTAIGIDVVDCIPFCIIQGRLDEEPSTIAFQPTYEQGSLLTIGWSNGNIEYVPFMYTCTSTNESVIDESSAYPQNTTKPTQASSNSIIEYLMN